LARGVTAQVRLTSQEVLYEGSSGSARSAAVGEAKRGSRRWLFPAPLGGSSVAATAEIRRSFILVKQALHNVFYKDD
jgi:hypothetical protein